MESKLKIPSFIFLILTLTMSFNIDAQTMKAKRAIVAVDGAGVYQKPDFDSEVLTYLNTGEVVISSVKTFQGAGGIGLFFAIKTSKGLAGFIADTDLIDATSKKPMSPLMKDAESANIARKDIEKSTDPGEKEPLYFTRFLGASVGRKGYSIKHQGRTYSSDMTFFGIRSTGPGTLFDGPPLDFNLLVSLDSPEFYKEISGNSPNGFLVYTDLLLQLPAYEKDNHLFYYGFGFMATYSSYRVQTNNRFNDEKGFRLGAEIDAGYAYRVMKKHLVRLDYKYHFERFQNTSFWLSVMTEY